MSCTPKREKRPPKRYADSPILLANKKKREQKSPGSSQLVSHEVTLSSTSPITDAVAVAPTTTSATPPRAVSTTQKPQIGSPKSSGSTVLPKTVSATSPKGTLASTTAALAARLNAPAPVALAGLVSIVPPYVDSAPNSGTSSPLPTGTSSPLPTDSQDTPPAKICPIFKDPNFIHSTKGASGGKKLRVWKTLKQIIVTERSLPWKPDDATYGSLDAPPSFTPAKKYSDITGLPAKYTDPHTKVRYATTEEYQTIRNLTSDIATGYLTLRKANIAV